MPRWCRRLPSARIGCWSFIAGCAASSRARCALAATLLLFARDAAGLVHGLRAVDDARRVVRVRRAVRRRGRALDVDGMTRRHVDRCWARCWAWRSSRGRRRRCSRCFPATLLLHERPRRSASACAARRGSPAWAFVGALPFLAAASGPLERSCSAASPSRSSGDSGYLDLLHSRWADTLWSSWHGFFSWTPIAYVAFVGDVLLRRQAIGGGLSPAILIVLVMAWVNGATADWAGGWSFGGRRFVSVLVVLAPGLACVVHGLARRPMVALVLVAVRCDWVESAADRAVRDGAAAPGAGRLRRHRPATGRGRHAAAVLLSRSPFQRTPGLRGARGCRSIATICSGRTAARRPST